MAPVTITLVTQGNLKYPLNLEYIRNWPTKLFKIVGVEKVESLPNSYVVPSGYSDLELARIFAKSDQSDITLAIVGAQLELNFYARVLPSGVVVLSLFEMGDILSRANHTVETFIVRCIYAMVVAYAECGGSLTLSRAMRLHHDETRGCLYDFNQDKFEIVRSLDRPKLCTDCLARLGHAQLDRTFIPALLAELNRIRKGRYYRILDWAKKNPIKVLLLTTLWAVVLNMAASLAYELCKSVVNRPTATSSTMRLNSNGEATSTPVNPSHVPPR